VAPSSGAPSPVPVSVVIPAYNRSARIGRAVATALRQEPRPPAEVIVVDDCSTDATADAARRAGAAVVRHEVNRGVAAARNTAIEHASQPWVAFLDSDDEWLPDHLASLWSARADHVLVAGATLRCESGGRDRYIGPVRRGGLIVRSPADVATVPLITTSGVMVRRDVAIAVGGFRPLHVSEDIDLWLRVLEHGTGYLSPAVSLLYHVHSQQVSSDGFRLQAGRRDVIASFSDRPWFTPRLLRDWDTSMGWDMARSAHADGDPARAARLLVPILVDPRRARRLAVILMDRWRGRRRTRRIARSGAPTIALMGTQPEDPRTPLVVQGTTYEPLVPEGASRFAQYRSLARRPAAALLVTRRADRCLARLLGMRAVRGPGR
jgi:GT2 family glycosyltransferase